MTIPSGWNYIMPYSSTRRGRRLTATCDGPGHQTSSTFCGIVEQQSSHMLQVLRCHASMAAYLGSSVMVSPCSTNATRADPDKAKTPTLDRQKYGISCINIQCIILGCRLSLKHNSFVLSLMEQMVRLCIRLGSPKLKRFIRES